MVAESAAGFPPLSALGRDAGERAGDTKVHAERVQSIARTMVVPFYIYAKLML